MADGNYADDIDTQLSNNYSYDKIGNLASDASEEIDTISWNVEPVPPKGETGYKEGLNYLSSPERILDF